MSLKCGNYNSEKWEQKLLYGFIVRSYRFDNQNALVIFRLWLISLCLLLRIHFPGNKPCPDSFPFHASSFFFHLLHSFSCIITLFWLIGIIPWESSAFGSSLSGFGVKPSKRVLPSSFISIHVPPHVTISQPWKSVAFTLIENSQKVNAVME